MQEISVISDKEIDKNRMAFLVSLFTFKEIPVYWIRHWKSCS